MQYDSNLFDANYFQTGLGLPYERNSHWLNFFALIAEEIIRSIRPRTVFDAGCAMGMLVESLWDRGVITHGVDISSYAISQVRRDMQQYCREASLLEPIDGHYELVTCIEVLEHLSPEQTETAIANLAAASDAILFSSSPTDLVEPTHFNVRPMIDWLKLFANVGFWPDCVFDASFVAPHAVLLRKQPELSRDILVLFSEKIRLKCALVEREQRIGNLNQKIASEAERGQLSEDNARLLGEVNELRERHAQVSNELLELRNREDQVSLEYQRLLSETELTRLRVAESESEKEAVRREAAESRTALDVAIREAAKERKDAERGLREIARIRVQETLTPLKSLTSRGLKEIWLAVTFRRSAQLWKRREFMRRLTTVGNSSLFDPIWYLENYPDVAAAGLNPLLHYLEHGALEGRNPGPKFDAKRYLERYPDVAKVAVGPLVHYLEFGETEGREIWPVLPVSNSWNSDSVRRFELVRKSSFFDTSWYLENYPDVAAAGANPLVHYLERGELEGRNPGPKFDANRYLERYPDVAESDAGPLVHYLEFGQREGRESGRAPASGGESVVAEDSAGSPECESYESWIARTEPGPELLQLQRDLCGNLRLQPLISVLVPVYRVPIEVLRAMVESVLNQTYRNWELCIAHAYAPDVEGAEYLTSMAAQDARIKVKLLEVNAGISGNSNAALELVQGEFIALLDHDDALAPFALFEVATALNEHPDTDFLYSDKDLVTEDGRQRLRPLFKPQWSPDTMLSANYLTHLSVIRTNMVRACGGWRSETDGAQDWDIFLQVLDAGARIVHVPGALYHWRIISTSVSSGGVRVKPYVVQAQIHTVDAHAERRGLRARARTDDKGLLKMEWNGAEERSVSVILVSSSSDAHRIEDRALRIDALTEWPQVEVIAPCSANSQFSGRVRSASREASDSVASFLNRAVQESRGEYLVFLDDSVEFSERDWLKELVGPLEAPKVALVGAKLLNPLDSKLRHAGLVFNADGTLDYVFSHEPEHICEQFGAACWYRNWSAVAGACFAIRREAFERAGGFRENPDYPRHDVDLCLRVRAGAGDRILYNPFARFLQTRTAVLERWLLPDGLETGAVYIRECLPHGDEYFHKDLESRSGKVQFASRRTGKAPNDYAAEARALVGAFDADLPLIQKSKAQTSGPRTNSLQRITWVLPQFDHAFYGGVHTILRFANHFSRCHGVESEFVYLGRVPEQIMRSRLATAFPELAVKSAITNMRSYDDWGRVNASDATVSTLWTTAYAALRFENTRRKFYFVQDYESSFYPAGSTYALVEATYRFGYHGICNTQPLSEMYREFGGDAEYFDPCIDPQYFFEPTGRGDGPRPFRIFCYARPGHPRNCFELLTAALQKVKQHLGNQVQIFSAGAEWNPADYGLKDVVENLGLLGYTATGALYRTCDAGVVMMLTRHPSYLPMELMACGSLVITNENRYTRWLLEHERNCLLSETSASAVADAIVRGLENDSLRKKITAQAAQVVRSQYSNWDAQGEKIYEYMVNKS